MIFIFYFFCILNLLFLYFKFDILYYLILFEGIFELIILLKISSKNIVFPFKMKYKISSVDLKNTKIYLLICSLLLILLFPLYIFNIIPYDTSTFFLCALPILFLGFISNKLKKYQIKK